MTDKIKALFVFITEEVNKLVGAPQLIRDEVFSFVYAEQIEDLGFDKFEKHAFEDLIKTVVVGNPCMSVTPVPNLLRMYNSCFPEGEPEVIEWIYENRTNSYDPFGREDWGQNPCVSGRRCR